MPLYLGFLSSVAYFFSSMNDFILTHSMSFFESGGLGLRLLPISLGVSTAKMVSSELVFEPAEALDPVPSSLRTSMILETCAGPGPSLPRRSDRLTAAISAA